MLVGHSELRFPFKASIFRLYETDLPLVTVERLKKKKQQLCSSNKE